MYKFLKTYDKKLVRFFLSGVIASGINFITYTSLYLIFSNLLFSSIFGYLAGIIISFVFSKYWVFKKSSSQTLYKSFSLFCFIYFLGGMEMSLVIIFLNRLIENYEISWLFGASIGTMNNFLGSKYLVFKK